MSRLPIMYAQPTVIVFNRRCVGSSPESVWQYERSLVSMITLSETFQSERMPHLICRDETICAVRHGLRPPDRFSETQVLKSRRHGRISVIGTLLLSRARMHFEGHI